MKNLKAHSLLCDILCDTFKQIHCTVAWLHALVSWTYFSISFAFLGLLLFILLHVLFFIYSFSCSIFHVLFACLVFHDLSFMFRFSYIGFHVLCFSLSSFSSAHLAYPNRGPLEGFGHILGLAFSFVFVFVFKIPPFESLAPGLLLARKNGPLGRRLSIWTIDGQTITDEHTFS